MSRPVLITGATGFVGQHLQREMAATYPDQAIVPVGAGRGPGEVMDLTDEESILTVLRRHRPRTVIHLAAIAAPSEARADPSHAWNVNVEGTRRLARGLMTVLEGQSRLVFVGSAEAYGAAFNAQGTPVTEAAALRPISAYGVTKAAADILVGQLAHEGLDVCRFRPFNHTGPGQSDAYVVPTFARQVAAVMKGEAPPEIRVGNLDAARDFMDVRDVVKAYAAAAMAPTPFRPESVYNIASGTSVTIRDMLERMIALSGRKIEIIVDPARLRPNDIPLAVGDPSAIRERLGWSASRSIDRIVADVLESWL